MEALYDSVHDWVMRAQELHLSLIRRAALKASLSPSAAGRIIKWSFTGNVLSSRFPDVTREMFDVVATPEERADPIFAVLRREYHMEGLAALLMGELRLSKIDIENLLKVQELKKRQLEKINPKIVFVIIFAAAATVLQTVPAELFATKLFSELGLSYAGFKIIVFGLLLFSVVTLGASTGFFYVKYRNARRRLEEIETILTYCSIVEAARRDESASTPAGVGGATFTATV